MDSTNDETFEKTFTICHIIEFILKLKKKWRRCRYPLPYIKVLNNDDLNLLSHDLGLSLDHKLWSKIRLNPGILRILELSEWKTNLNRSDCRAVTTLISEDREFYFTSFDVCKIFFGVPPTQTPTQKWKIIFSMFGS